VLELSNITQKPQILSTDETQAKTEKLNLTISHLMNNLTHVNETLSSKLQWVADDQDKDRVSNDVMCIFFINTYLQYQIISFFIIVEKVSFASRSNGSH